MERKEMVRLLESHSGAKAKYLGVPSCNYEIEIQHEKYIICKDGRIKNSTGDEANFEAILQFAVEGAAEPLIQTTVFEQLELSGAIEATEHVTVEVTIPMEGHTGITLRNLMNIIYSKQALIKKSLGFTCNIIEAEFCKGINESKIETLDHFRTAKESLEEKHCPGIAFDFNNKTITFKFLEEEVRPEKVQAYTQFVALLNQSAKVLKHASARAKDTDNDKFTFRVFLIRLGMVGDEYKAARKVLLENLEGNSAFRSGKKPERI